MSTQGFMLCEDCKEIIFLGKLRGADETGEQWFWHVGLTEEQAGHKVMRFAATHVRHSIRVVTDHVLYAEYDLMEYEHTDEQYGDSTRLELNAHIRRRKEWVKRKEAQADNSGRQAPPSDQAEP